MVETVEIRPADLKLLNGMQLSGTAEDIFDCALAFCARQMNVNDVDVIVRLLSDGNRTAVEYCFYALAKHTAAFLGSVDTQISAAYVIDYDPLCEGEICPPVHQGVPTLHLILRAERKTAALDSLVAALDRALTEHYAHLLERPHAQSLLNVQVVDEAEAASGAWPGNLLHALYHRPVQLWQR